MSGTIYEDTMRHMWDIMWSRRHNWPSVQACSDIELRMLWAETEDRYKLYCRIAEQAELRRKPQVALIVSEQDKYQTEEYIWSTETQSLTDPCDDDYDDDDAAIDRMYERADEVSAELDLIDVEWRRRPWLEQYN